MAENNYNPFSGFSGPRRGQNKNNGDDMAAKMKPIDWESKTLAPAKWKVVDVQALKKAAGARTPSSASSSGPAPTATAATGSDDNITPGKVLSAEESEEWRAKHSITVSEPNCPPPMTQFDMLSGVVPRYLLSKLTDQGFAAPTSVQAQCWPILFTGRDLVGVAKTGSGKTLAFVVPALAHIALQQPLQPGDGPMVVVLAPTRELAQQIEQETIKVLPQNLRCACVYGGAPKGPQLGMMRQGCHVLIATPGRLIDFLEIKRVNMFRCTYLVLDEADRMLDMGFEPQVRAICGQIRPDRQTLMFSATWPREIQALASSFQRNWIRVNVGSAELLANKDVTQHFVLTDDSRKFDELKRLMEAHRNQRVLVFCKTKRTADFLEHQLKRTGVDAMAIHGDKEQRQREFILDRFRKDSRLCLVATDVAARGLDIKELETVVNYDFPMVIDDYVHRIGRTGRAGAKGSAHTFITRHEDQLTPQVARQLIGIVERADQEVPVWLREYSAQAGPAIVAKRNRNMTGGFAGRRGAPQMQMPNGQMAPSFDARARAREDGGGNHFGLGAHKDGPQAFGSKAIPNIVFADSDDEKDHPPKKRSKAE